MMRGAFDKAHKNQETVCIFSHGITHLTCLVIPVALSTCPKYKNTLPSHNLLCVYESPILSEPCAYVELLLCLLHARCCKLLNCLHAVRMTPGHVSHILLQTPMYAQHKTDHSGTRTPELRITGSLPFSPPAPTPTHPRPHTFHWLTQKKGLTSPQAFL